MEHITTLDLAVIFVYLAAMLGIGLWFIRRIKGTSDFYVAGRSLGTVVLMATVCATIIGGSALIGRGGYAYKGGVVSIAIALPYMIGMFAFTGFTGRISDIGRRHGVTSIPELMGLRFGKAVKLISAFMIAYSMAATVGAQISATATVFNVIGGSFGITYIWGAVIATAIFVIYTVVSGMYGVAYTDLVQFFILIIFVYITLPIMSVREVGGLQALIAATPKEKFQFNIEPEIFALIFTNLVVTLAGAEFWQRAFSAKDRRTAFRGQLLGTSVYSVTIVITMFIGLSAAILYPTLIQDYGTADYAIPVMVASILPSGLTGLTFAGLLAVMMSSADSCILVATQATVNDFWKTLDKSMDDKKELMVSRVATVVIAVFALVVALFFTSAYDALMFAWTFYAASMGLPCLAALYWKRATKPGMLAGMGAGFVGSVAWKLLSEPGGVSATLVGCVLCAVALVAVSLITCKKHPSVQA